MSNLDLNPDEVDGQDVDITICYQQLKPDGRLQLPEELRKAADLWAGELLEMTFADGVIFVQPMRLLVAAVRDELTSPNETVMDEKVG